MTLTNSNAVNHTVTLEELVKNFSAPGQEHLLSLVKTFTASIVNPDFSGNRNKVINATVALTLPDPEKRIGALLRSQAEKSLRAEAGANVEKNGGVYVAPTQADIDAKVNDGLAKWRKANIK